MSRVLILTIVLSIFVSQIFGVVCSSNEYCPAGWSVMRKEDGGALTCDPIDRERAKCPKPYMCIASKCGLKFCCANDKMADKQKQAAEDEADAASDDEIDTEQERAKEL